MGHYSDLVILSQSINTQQLSPRRHILLWLVTSMSRIPGLMSLMVFQIGLPLMLIMLKIQSHSNPTIKYGSPSVLINQNSYPLEQNTIIDNWVILPNGCIAGTAFRTDTEFKNAPKTHSKTDTHGVLNYKYLPSIATNVVLSLCCPRTLRLDSKSDFRTVKEYTNVTTLSGSSYYLAKKEII